MVLIQGYGIVADEIKTTTSYIYRQSLSLPCLDLSVEF